MPTDTLPEPDTLTGRDHPPLRGICVLDLSRVLAGPWATQLLADYGAEVVKVERPGSGDDTRGWGPPFEADGSAAYFSAANRNKRSVAIDMASEAGRGVIRQLAARSHVVVENFKAGGLARYGLDYPSLSAVNPGVVYCSITGFGQTGAAAARPGYDYLVQAAGGLMSITGAPDGEPMKVGVAVADLFTGLYAVTGILAALREAEATGRGRHLDVALHDCQLAMLANQASSALATGRTPRRLGNQHPSIVPYQTFDASNGPIVLAVGNDAQFAAFARVAGEGALAEDERFATNRARVENREALITRLAPVIAQRTAEDWQASLEAAGVPCGPIRDVAQALASDEARDRGMILTHEDGRRTVASPVDLGGRAEATAPPTFGQHTDEVLTELGLGEADIAALREAGAVA